MSYAFIESARETLKDSKPSSKLKAKNAVLDYLEDKLNRYTSVLPKSSVVMQQEWKYGDSWGKAPNLSYRILVNAYARVIHVHCENKKIARAHFIHKLVEEDDPGVPANRKKVTPKLEYADGEFNQNRAAKFGDLPTGPIKRQLGNSTHQAMQVLKDHKATIDERFEAIIYIADGRDATKRYPYNGGQKYIAEQLLAKIVNVINEGAGAGSVTGIKAPA